MVEVTFYRDSRDRLSSVFAQGHAGLGEHGQDIVCAAVSAILQSMRLGLETYAGIALEANQEAGEMHLRWPESARDEAALRAIVTTAELSIERIAEQYPEQVRVTREPDRAQHRGRRHGI